METLHAPECVVIRCSHCNSRFCSQSILKLYGHASKEAWSDPLLTKLKDICNNGPYDHVLEVIGFCCHIKKLKHEQQWSPPEESMHSQLKRLVMSGAWVISGFLFLPALQLFLSSPNDIINIHGLGSMSDIADSLAHCCPSEGEAGIFPHSFKEHPAWASCNRIKKLKHESMNNNGHPLRNQCTAN